jgi:hypothetical protein
MGKKPFSCGQLNGAIVVLLVLVIVEDAVVIVVPK